MISYMVDEFHENKNSLRFLARSLTSSSEPPYFIKLSKRSCTVLSELEPNFEITYSLVLRVSLMISGEGNSDELSIAFQREELIVEVLLSSESSLSSSNVKDLFLIGGLRKVNLPLSSSTTVENVIAFLFNSALEVGATVKSLFFGFFFLLAVTVLCVFFSLMSSFFMITGSLKDCSLLVVLSS